MLCTVFSMLNWIRWNRTLVISFLVGALLVSGGAYTIKAIQSANSTAAYALTVEEVLSCETAPCVTSAIAAADGKDLTGLLDELSKQAKPLSLQPASLTNSGGLCGIAGKEIGRRVAADMSPGDAAKTISEITLTVTEQDSVVAYPCQLGFVTGIGEKLAASVGPDNIQAGVAALCPDQAKETTSDRISYDIKDTLCSRAAGVMTVYASSNSFTWETSVDGCNGISENNVVPCLNAAAAELRNVATEPKVELADCTESKRPGFCELIVASIKVSPQSETLAASDNPLQSFESICKTATSLEACRHGYILGVVPSVQFIDVCGKMGSLSTLCEDVVLTRTASAYLRISNKRGEGISIMCVSLPVKTRERCDKVVDGILDYRFENGLV
jgi:hypothetical protein